MQIKDLTGSLLNGGTTLNTNVVSKLAFLAQVQINKSILMSIIRNPNSEEVLIDEEDLLYIS